MRSAPVCPLFAYWTVLLSLANPTPTGLATLGAQSTATLTILDVKIYADGFEDATWCAWDAPRSPQ